MANLVIATTVEGTGKNPIDVNFIASTIEKAENKLIEDGFEKVTDSWEEMGYQTWIKKMEATFFCQESLTYVTVKNYLNFIG